MRRVLVDDHQTVFGLGDNIGFCHLPTGDTQGMARCVWYRPGSFLCLAHERSDILARIKAGKGAGTFVHLRRRIRLLRNIGSALRAKYTRLRVRSSRFPLPIRQRRFGRSLDRAKPALVERLAQAADDHPANHCRFAKAHFGLRRMDIHIDQFRRHFDEQGHDRMTVPGEHFGIGATHRSDQQPVLDRASVDEQKLVIGDTPIISRQTCHAGQVNFFPLQIDADAIGAQIAAGQRGHPFGAGLATLNRNCLASLMLKREPDIGPRHCQSPDNIGASGIFAARRAEEFAACRYLAEQLLDPDLGSRRNRGRPFVHKLAMIDNAGPAIFAGHAAFNRHPCHAGDRWQRLAAKSHGGHQFNRFVRQFRCCMAFQRQGDVVPAHSATIVRDLDQVQPALVEPDIDLACPGVNRIFDELFQCAGGALDNLSGSDPIYQAIWKSSY